MKRLGPQDIWSRLARSRLAGRVVEDLSGERARQELLIQAGYAGQVRGLARRLFSGLERVLPLACGPAEVRAFGRHFPGPRVMDQARVEAALPHPLADGGGEELPASQVHLEPEQRDALWPWLSGQRSARLARAAHLAGDEELALAAVRSLERFCAYAPPLMGPGWSDPQVVAVRVLNWLFTLRLLGHPDTLPPQSLLAVLVHLKVAGLVLEADLVRAGEGAHPLQAGLAGALLFLGQALDFLPPAEAWRELGRTRLGPALMAWSREQEPLSPLWLAPCAQWGGLGLWLGRKRPGLEMPALVGGLTRLAGLCRAAAPPWGGGVHSLGWGWCPVGSVLGFERGGDPFTTAANLAALLLRDPELRAGRVMDQNLFWLLGPAAAEDLRPLAPAHPPPAADHPGPGLSLLCLAAGKRRIGMCLRTSPRTPGADAPWPAQALALTLCLDGRPLLVAPGPAGSGPLSEHLRSRSAQNAVVIDRQEPRGGRVVPEGLEAGDRHAFLAARYDGYAHLADPVILRRRLFFDRAGSLVQVVDQVQGRQEHLCEIFFHLAPGTRVTKQDQGLLLEADWGRVLMRPEPKAGLEVISGRSNPPLGWLADQEGGVMAAPVVRIYAPVEGSVRLTTVLALG